MSLLYKSYFVNASGNDDVKEVKNLIILFAKQFAKAFNYTAHHFLQITLLFRCQSIFRITQ
jgi:hypothetical protein